MTQILAALYACEHWQYLSRPATDTGDKSGNPPSLIKLRDGRLAIAYGHRAPQKERTLEVTIWDPGIH